MVTSKKKKKKKAHAQPENKMVNILLKKNIGLWSLVVPKSETLGIEPILLWIPIRYNIFHKYMFPIESSVPI